MDPTADVDPTGQTVHAVEPATENMLAGHGAMMPPGQSEPAGHVVHVEALAEE